MDCAYCYSRVDDASEVLCSGDECHTSCHECARNYASVMMGNGKVVFPCPAEPKCNGFVLDYDTEEVLGPALYASLCRMQQKNELESANIPDLYECPMCPFAAIYSPKEDGDVFWCQNPTCMKPTCAICKLGAHWNRKCPRSPSTSNGKEKETGSRGRLTQRKLREEHKNMELIKPCSGCGSSISKDGGCNRVVCSVCNTAMCWLCQSTVSSTDYGHFLDLGMPCKLFKETPKPAEKYVASDTDHETETEMSDSAEQAQPEAVPRMTHRRKAHRYHRREDVDIMPGPSWRPNYVGQEARHPVIRSDLTPRQGTYWQDGRIHILPGASHSNHSSHPVMVIESGNSRVRVYGRISVEQRM